jgi:hypothetical protein
MFDAKNSGVDNHRRMFDSAPSIVPAEAHGSRTGWLWSLVSLVKPLFRSRPNEPPKPIQAPAL